MLAGLAVAEDVDQDQDTAYAHGSDLERNTGYDKAVATVNELFVGGPACSSHASTHSLKHNRSEIAANEDPRIETRLDDGMLWSTVEDKVFEGKVDGGSNETRAEDQATDLQLEARLAPGVVIHDDATRISGGFEKRADAQGKRISPCLGHDTNDDASEAAESEESAEEGIATEVGTVSVKCCVDGAFRRYFETLAEVPLGPICGGGHDDGLGGEEEGGDEASLCVRTHCGRNGRTVPRRPEEENEEEAEEGKARKVTADSRQQARTTSKPCDSGL